MEPDVSLVGRVLAVTLAAPLLGSCDVIREIGEFCSQESLAVTTTSDLRRPCREGECSLWGAIAAANTCSSGMTVTIPEGSRIVLGIPPADAGSTPANTIFPAITGRLAIQGNGSEVARIRTVGAPPDRFFVIQPRGNLTISGLSLQGGGSDESPHEGGAILNHGTLTLQDVELAGNRSGLNGGAIENKGHLWIRGGRYLDNRTHGCDEHGGGAVHNAAGADTRVESGEFRNNQGCGGAILNAGRLVVVNSTFANNRGGGSSNNTYNHGGALMNEPVDLPAVATIVGSTFSGNRAMVGAAILNSSGGEMAVHSSTLSGNVAHVPCPACVAEDDLPSAASAAIASGGTLELRDVTIIANVCEDALPVCQGGIVVNGDAGRTSIRNSIIAEHPDGDCWDGPPSTAPSSLESIGTNLDSDSSCPGFTIHRPPNLGPLADNGGPTHTRAILPGSPALDVGTSCLARDQRGLPRPGSAADPCDLGAFEQQR
jgi:hypothetical protein